MWLCQPEGSVFDSGGPEPDGLCVVAVVDDATDTPDNNTLVAEGGDLATLVLENVRLEDEGYYCCVISNQLDSLR